MEYSKEEEQSQHLKRSERQRVESSKYPSSNTCESHAPKIRSENTSSVPSICLDTLGFLHTREKPSLRMLAVHHHRSLPPPPDLRRKIFRNT
uniref:Uncharacterized protein n=1 Tax=Solanum lycopersicum TaxID=4081 RepID=A0A3Q7EL69_SOLLC